MKVDAITEKILEDARQSAAQTLREANERAQETQRRSEAEIVKKRDQAMDEARRECVGLRDRMLRMAELDERKNLLSMKRQVIDQAFEDALKRMRAMDEASARAYLKRLILESAQGGEQIITDSADRKLYSEAFLAELNAELKKRGGSGALTLSDEKRPMAGGFVLKRQGVEINCTYEAVLRESRASLEAQVASMLFR